MFDFSNLGAAARGLICSAFIACGSVASANTECFADTSVQGFVHYKQMFAAGDFDDFFAKTEAEKTLDQETLQATKVGLVQVLGVASECTTLFEKSYSDVFHADLTMFSSDTGDLVFVYLAAVKTKEEFKILTVQISTDFVQIHRFLR